MFSKGQIWIYLAVMVVAGTLAWQLWTLAIDDRIENYMQQHVKTVPDGMVLVNDWSAFGEKNEDMQQWIRIMTNELEPSKVFIDTFFVYRNKERPTDN